MSGTLGRFGIGVGFAIQEPRLVLPLRERRSISIRGDFADLSLSLIKNLRNALPSADRFALECRSGIPRHCGLGSETMLSLSVGEAYSLATRNALTVERIASIVRCSSHSGVGLCAYVEGGFAVDSGYTKASLDAIRPVTRLLRLPMPADWRVILALLGGSGFATQRDERHFWDNRDPIAEEESARLARMTISLLLPSIVHGDFDVFAGL